MSCAYVLAHTVRLPTARGCPPLLIRLDRPVPYPPPTIRAVTLLFLDGRLHLDVTAELPVAAYPAGREPDPGRVAGVDLGIIHPFAVAGPDGEALLVSGRAIRAERRVTRLNAIEETWGKRQRHHVAGGAGLSRAPESSATRAATPARP